MEDAAPSSPVGALYARLEHEWSRRMQVLLDRVVPYLVARWVFTVVVLTVYVVRVVVWPGWYIVSYGLGIYLLNVLVDFVSPLEDPSTTTPSDLPLHQDDEFRPFLRKLPEFASWVRATRALLLALFLSLWSALDVPVFWPILLLYFLLLFVSTLKQRVQHMIRHRYLPVSLGKPSFAS